MNPAIINLIIALIQLEPAVVQLFNTAKLGDSITDAQIAALQASEHAAVQALADDLAKAKS